MRKITLRSLFSGGQSDPGLNLRTTPDLSGAGSLFGTLGKGALPFGAPFDFIPLDSGGKIFQLTGENLDRDARWLGLENKQMQFWAYNYCAPLAAVIDRLAEADTNGRIEFVDDDGITVKNPNKNPKLLRVKNLLHKPNPWQTWEEFNSEQVVICKTFGYCPVFAVGPTGFDKSYTKYLFNLNPYFVTPVANYEADIFFGDNKTGSLIKEWIINIHGKTLTIQPEDILLIKDGFINSVTLGNLGLPISKVAGLDFFVSNICAAMEADNVLLKKKGPLGIFSGDSKADIAGTTPMTPKAQEDLQDDLLKYGMTLGQLQYVISKWPVRWNPISFNLRDLMTKETIRSGIDGICDRFGYPAELMSGKNATYENRNSAEKFLYQNNIIPFSLRRMARYDEFFGLEGYNLFMDYDHLPVLQEDIMHAGQAFKALNEGLAIAWTSGFLTLNQVLVQLEEDTIPDGDIYYPDWLKKNPSMQQANIKISKTNPEKKKETTKSIEDENQ